MSSSGTERLTNIIKDMTGVTVNPLFTICWRYLTPLMCLVGAASSASSETRSNLRVVRTRVQPPLASALLHSQGAFICSLVWYTPLVFNQWYEYPTWANVLGWVLALSSILLVPGFALYMLATSPGTLKQVGERNIQLFIQNDRLMNSF